MADKSIAKSVYDAIVAMAKDPKNKNKSPLKMIVDYLSSNPKVKNQKAQLVAVATKAKGSSTKPLGSPDDDDALVKRMVAKGKKKPLDTPELNKAERDTLERNLAKDKRLRKENRNIDKALRTPLKTIWEEEPRQDRPSVPKAEPVIAVTQKPAGPVINTGESNAPSAQLTAVRKHLKAKETDKPFGEKAGRKAIQSFFKDTFGYTPTVTYDAPGQGDDQMEFYGKKKGGKVTAKRPTAKKYVMNRGGKSASVRKPTRA
jgi:hypothetical protein|tara:strand:- start:207 stop:983 length:777 start_codon:yes stop_codon:yes gene_type:complete